MVELSLHQPATMSSGTAAWMMPTPMALGIVELLLENQKALGLGFH